MSMPWMLQDDDDLTLPELPEQEEEEYAATYDDVASLVKEELCMAHLLDDALPKVEAQLTRLRGTKMRVNNMTLTFDTDLPKGRTIEEMAQTYAKQLTLSDRGKKPFKNCVILRTALEGGRNLAVKVFKNGKLHVTGANSLTEAREGVGAAFGPETVPALVSHAVLLVTAVFDVRCKVDIQRFGQLLEARGAVISLNKEKYSGLIVRQEKRGAAAVFFGSGKGQVTGAKSVEQLMAVYSFAMGQLELHAGEVLLQDVCKDEEELARPRKRGRRRKDEVAALYDELLA